MVSRAGYWHSLPRMAAAGFDLPVLDCAVNLPKEKIMQESANNNSKSQKLSAEIRKTWSKLTDEEIGFLAGKPDKFYEAVKTKYSINKDEAERTVKKLEAESSTSTSAPTDTLPKVANA